MGGINWNRDKKLLIVGAGDHSQVVREVAESLGFGLFSYLDDRNFHKDVIGAVRDINKFVDEFKYVFISIGDNVLRKKLQGDAIRYGYSVPSLLSPYAYVSSTATIGVGCLVCPMACIQSNSIVGDGCFISTGAIIDHDVIIGEYCHVNVGVICMSGTTIEDNSKIENKNSYCIKNSNLEEKN